MFKKLSAVSVLALTLTAGSAGAATYNITAMLDGVDSAAGFGFSTIHSQSSGKMGGSIINNLNPSSFVVGTWNSISGAISFGANLFSGGSFSATGDIDTNALGAGTTTGVGGYIDMTFAGVVGIADNTYHFIFDDWLKNTAPNAPNGFNSATNYISLWGDLGNYSSANCGGRLPAETCMGMDLRLALTPAAVPLPASILFLGAGIAGLFGTRHLKKKTS